MAAVSVPQLGGARRLVVKIGSALLVGPEGLRGDWLRGLCDDVAAWRAQGCDVVLVSSGSIALGRRVLGLPSGALPLEQAQAAGLLTIVKPHVWVPEGWAGQIAMTNPAAWTQWFAGYRKALLPLAQT